MTADIDEKPGQNRLERSQHPLNPLARRQNVVSHIRARTAPCPSLSQWRLNPPSSGNTWHELREAVVGPQPLACLDLSRVQQRPAASVPPLEKPGQRTFSQIDPGHDLSLTGGAWAHLRSHVPVLVLKVATAQQTAQCLAPRSRQTQDFFLSLFDQTTRDQGFYKAFPDTKVIPVAVNSGMFWGKDSFMKYGGRVTMELMKPIEPGLDRKTFMSEIKTRIDTRTRELETEAQQEFSLPMLTSADIAAQETSQNPDAGQVEKDTAP